ncbi:MAG: right-handed parallel beta-helix repeat-containing protein, partial [Clostridia bacterium]|nr:right-handed parallel beta-helix repeat-containing protein [Clostridia bacterium]
EWGDPLFSPDRNITRQELATMFARYAAYRHVDTTKNTADITTFPDAGKVASWASDSFKWSSGTGIITGKTNGGATTLSPEDLATRAEFAIMIQRYNTKDDAREFTYFLAYETPVIKNSYTEPEYEKVENADVYVAVDGLDTNPGTKEKPLATLEAAKAKVREIKKTKTSGEIVVAFMAGDYGVLNNVSFTAEDSGSDKLKITYCAYGDGEVYFTNGVYIEEGDFTALSDADKKLFNADYAGDIKKVDLTKYPAAADVTTHTPLSNASGFCWQARVPNKANGTDTYYNNFTRFVATPDSPYTMEEIMALATEFGYGVEHTVIRPYTEQKKIQAIRTMKDKLDSYDTVDGVQLIGYISKVWHSDTLNIKSYDKTTGVVEFYNEANYGFVNVDEPTQAYISNASLELDDVGEYWIDANTKTLYVYKPQGNYSMATEDTFMTLDRNAAHISLVNLNFRICVGDGIYAHGDNFTMDQCSISYVGGEHAFKSDGAINLVIKNSTFAYCAETAVFAEGPEPGERADFDYYTLPNSGFVFDNNLIHDVDLVRVPVESGGLRVRYQIGGLISHNEIYNSARYGIDFKYGNIDCIFEYNYLHHCMQNSADGGAFYCGRVATNRGNEIRYNVIADIYAINPVHTGGTYSIYMDDCMEGLICYGNVFFNCGTIMNNRGRSNEIRDNVYIGDAGIAGRANADFFDISLYADPHLTDETDYSEGWNDLDRIPDENTPAGKIWKEKWPELYDIVAIRKNPDIDVTKLAFYSMPLNICTNNYTFDGAAHGFCDEWIENSKHENNLDFAADENPFFTDPTHGDYSIADTTKFLDNRFDMVGRY